MRITIDQVLDSASGRVAFRCQVGHAWGVWKGESPVALGDYDVEFDIPDEVREVTVEDPASGTMLTASESGSDAVLVTGAVEGIDDDGVITLRVGVDLILVETSEVSAGITVGQSISFKVPQIDLYPYQI